MDMWHRWSHILSPLKEVASVPECREIIWNDELEVSFRDLKCIVST